jgi:hypothetical protein
MRSNEADVHRSVRTRPAGVPMRPIRWCNPFALKAGAAAIGCLLLVLAPSAVEGQSLEGCGIDLRGGAAIAVGELRDELNHGLTLGAALDCQTRSPWTLRGGVELAVLDPMASLSFGQASALTGGELSVPLERWPMLLRARLEGGWTFTSWSGAWAQPRRFMLSKPGPVLAPGVGVTLESGDGRQTRLDAGARILFQSPKDQVPDGSGSYQTGFNRLVWFVLTMGFRL